MDNLSVVPGDVVVGVDGSPNSQAAVRWAALEAGSRHVPLRVLLAYEWVVPGIRFTVDPDLRDMVRQLADAVVADAAQVAREVAPQVPVTAAAVAGNPAQILLDATQSAGLLVVGNRGRGGFASLLLGSVSQRVAMHAWCPVVVVRGRTEATGGAVVVGVDGSAGADDALAMSFEYAARHACPLTAVRAYLPPTPIWGPDMPPLDYDHQALHAAEQQALEESLTGWWNKYPQVTVERLVARGSAGRVLVGVSHGARLLAIGSQGHGALAGTLLGSVGLQVLHHADCPVLVVRA